MSQKPHVDNPYHFSFKLCAIQASNGTKKEESTHHRKFRDTYYDEYLKPKSDFYCDLCDRGFSKESQLEAHNSEHVTCGREGCKFTAHEKIVANHVRVQHATGIFSKIKKLHDPEEVKKWLEERKRKYPTANVAQHKLKLEEAKKARGETIQAPKNRFNKDFTKRVSGNKRGPKRRAGKKRTTTNTRNIINIASDTPEEITSNGAIPAFKGVGAMLKDEITEIVVHNNEFHISDDEDNFGAESTHSSSLIGNSSLGLLMNAYDSDASDEATAVLHQPSQLVTQPVCAVDNEHPDEVATVKSTFHPPESLNIQENRQKRKIKRNFNVYNKHKGSTDFVKRPRKPTLLQKLLSSDVNRETQTILVCVSYAVRNNFFEDSRKLARKSTAIADKVREPRLLKNLLQEDILRERNCIMQCVRYISDNNFFNGK